jgi:hypothetical protein
MGQIMECLEYENKLLASKEGGNILDCTCMIDMRLLKRTVMYEQQLLSQTCQNIANQVYGGLHKSPFSYFKLPSCCVLRTKITIIQSKKCVISRSHSSFDEHSCLTDIPLHSITLSSKNKVPDDHAA